jgi:prepilin-type N-terminal cleavage/methylation domain-containing protein
MSERVVHPRTPRAKRGYTAVELLMAISVFGIGVAGIISMEKVTSASNQHAKNLAIATHIAESWLDMLEADATAWNHPSPGFPADDLNDTVWLQNVKLNAGGGTGNDWFLPSYNPTLGFGPGFDALGNPVNTTTNLAAAQFCVHLRLSWLYKPPANLDAGNGLIRAEVRVFWLRNGQYAPVAGVNPCDPATPITSVSAATATSRFHFVQKITAIRENMKP